MSNIPVLLLTSHSEGLLIIIKLMAYTKVFTEHINERKGVRTIYPHFFKSFEFVSHIVLLYHMLSPGSGFIKVAEYIRSQQLRPSLF